MPIHARDSFLHCLLKMAEAETNPVLQVIKNHLPLEENKKYPEGLLQFSHTGWRAYYHCHPATRAGNHNFKGEHGHFHLFVQVASEPEQWSHLVALAMDNMGQPLGWFTVNHWVTGESWQDAAVLVSNLENIPYDKQTELIEQWLLSLLAMEADSIARLLERRDNILNKIEKQAKGDIKQDRDVYLLSETPLDLKEILDNY